MAKKTSKKTSKASAGTKPTRKPSGGKSDVLAALEELNETFESTPARSGGGGLPDGKYPMLIEAAEVGRAQSGRLQAVFTLKVMGGEFANRTVYKRDGIDNEDSIGWFKGGLTRLGIEVDGLKATDYPEVLNGLVGTYAEVNAKNKEGSEYTNYYFNKALDEDEIDLENLEQLEGEESGGEEEASEEEEGGSWSVGDKCQVDFDGDYYTGVIKKLTDENATVKFEDGATEVIDLENLEEFNPDGEEEEGGEEEGGEEEGGEEEESEGSAIVFHFEEDAITEKMQGEISKIAKANDFEPDDYETWSELLNDILEYHSVEGEFKSPVLAIKKAREAGE